MDIDIHDIGLDESEAKAYLALLELGPSTVTEITKKAGLHRTLGYHLMEKLSLQGLVNRVGKGKKLHYVAEHPQILIRHLKNIQRTWEHRVEKAELTLPDLLSIYKLSGKPVLRFQQGLNAVKRMHEECLGANGDILSILDLESWHTPEFLDWAKMHNGERNRQKVKEKILLLDTPAARDWINHYRGSRIYTNYRWIDGSEADLLKGFGGELHIYNNALMFSILKNPQVVGVTIESSILAMITRTLFELAWKNSRSVFQK